jgi:MraZ protein
MFRECSFHTIDAKGRIIIPTRFRDVIKADGTDSVMLSRRDGCVVAYTMEKWRDLEAQFSSLPKSSAFMRKFRRVFIGSAAKCACDKQGRILIPPPLRKYGELDKDIVLVGALECFEIWSMENWEKEALSLDEEMQNEEVRKEIDQLGI